MSLIRNKYRFAFASAFTFLGVVILGICSLIGVAVFVACLYFNTLWVLVRVDKEEQIASRRLVPMLYRFKKQSPSRVSAILTTTLVLAGLWAWYG